jgi:glycosyltransferase involved in cell wall biosynthesis
MAIELHQHGKLSKVITGYPRSRLKGEWFSLNKCASSILYFGIMWKLLVYLEKYKIPFFIATSLRRRLFHRFSLKTSSLIDANSDVIIGLSGFMLEVIQSKQNSGVMTIVDHGSLHEGTNKKILLEECERFGFPYFGNWKHDWMLKKMQLEFEYADNIFVCSQLAKKTLVENGINESKIFVNYLGIDLNKFKFQQKTSSNKFKFLHVSNMSPVKGLHYIIEAFNELNKIYENCELWLVGPLPKEKILQKMIYSNSSIKYFQAVPEHELVEFYHQCDIFVHPSLSDGWGMTVLQAMSTGLPVVVSDMTGSSEIVTNDYNGWIVKSRDVKELYEIMEFTLSNKNKLLSMGKNANKTVHENYTWQDYGNRLNIWLDKKND